MKKLLVSLFVLVFLSCEDPLDRVYEPVSLRTDFREIEEKHGSQEADKITYVLERDNPTIGATYREIIEDYPRVFQIQKTEDSLARAVEFLVDSITKAKELERQIKLEKWKQEAKQKKILRDKKRKQKEKEKAEYEKKRRALFKYKAQDRWDFKSAMLRYNITMTNVEISLDRYDKRLKTLDILWDELARLVIKEKEERGTDGYKILRVHFKLVVNEEEKEQNFYIDVPF